MKPKIISIKCLNCKKEDQRTYSHFCSFECKQAYMQIKEDRGNLKGKTPKI